MGGLSTDGVEDAAFLVDFEEAEDDGADFDGAEEGAGEGVWDAADGFCFDGIDVCVVALLGCPVDFYEGDFCVFLLWGEFFDQVGVALVEVDTAFVDREVGA